MSVTVKKGTTALVTGASRGLGFCFVKHFLESNKYANVIATCRTPAKATALQTLQKTSAGKGLAIVQLDVTDEKSIQEAAAQLKNDGYTKLDLLVNNAGICTQNHPNDPVLSVSKADMMKLFETNTVGPVLVTQAFYPLMLDSKTNADNDNNGNNDNNNDTRPEHPMILNMSSTLGSLATNSGSYTSYRASKVALNMAMNNMAKELEGKGITVVSVCPGWCDTDMGSYGGRSPPVKPENSVKMLYDNVIAKGHTSMSITGKFFQHTGEELRW